MIKWCVYIVFVLILTPCLSFAKVNHSASHPGRTDPLHHTYSIIINSSIQAVADTTPKKQTDDKKKIKEVTRAKPVPKPEKVDDAVTQPKTKPKRQRRPPGMERPPEIPRHNGN